MRKIKLIYNPFAAANKKSVLRPNKPTSLEEVQRLLKKYELAVDVVPTQGPNDATRLAKEAVAEGYDTVIAAGGDGTVGDVANGLIGTDVALGILPLGTYMNVARMLNIPFDLEAAVMLLKIGHVERIDVGKVTRLDGKELGEAKYFLETVGIGIEAELHRYILQLERGNFKALWKACKMVWGINQTPVILKLDNERTYTARAHVILISNGPYEGAGLPVAPSAKLNDSLLTITRFRMTKSELLRHLLRIKLSTQRQDKRIIRHTSQTVEVESRRPRPAHVEAREFGKTPITVTVVPKALNVISGFAEDPTSSALLKKSVTYLEP